jgi:hypothetical protein
MADHVEDHLARLHKVVRDLRAERERHEQAERPLLTERDQILCALSRKGYSLSQLAEVGDLRSRDSVRKALRRCQD